MQAAIPARKSDLPGTQVPSVLRANQDRSEWILSDLCNTCGWNRNGWKNLLRVDNLLVEQQLGPTGPKGAVRGRVSATSGLRGAAA